MVGAAGPPGFSISHFSFSAFASLTRHSVGSEIKSALEPPFNFLSFLQSINDGEDKEESGGGGARAAGRLEGREGAGKEAYFGAADRKRPEGGGGAVVR